MPTDRRALLATGRQQQPLQEPAGDDLPHFGVGQPLLRKELSDTR